MAVRLSLPGLVLPSYLLLSLWAHAQTPAPNAFSTGSPSLVSQPDPLAVNLQEGYRLFARGDFDAALPKLNAVLKVDPRNMQALSMRGSLYSQKKLWAQAQQDFQTMDQANPANLVGKFNLAELKFMQQQYDQARTDFMALESDEVVGDVSKYKVFLCDLVGHHEDAAAKELDAFNEVGSHPSYYFSNAAWDLAHHKVEDARGWLLSGTHIYAPEKFALYVATLKELGFLPLPASPPSP